MPLSALTVIRKGDGASALCMHLIAILRRSSKIFVGTESDVVPALEGSRGGIRQIKGRLTEYSLIQGPDQNRKAPRSDYHPFQKADRTTTVCPRDQRSHL